MGKGEKTKAQEENSREKLKVWEALTSYVYPSGVKTSKTRFYKQPDLFFVLNFKGIVYISALK